jgi:hypothetical protein
MRVGLLVSYKLPALVLDRECRSELLSYMFYV